MGRQEKIKVLEEHLEGINYKITNMFEQKRLIKRKIKRLKRLQEREEKVSTKYVCSSPDCDLPVTKPNQLCDKCSCEYNF